MARKRKMTNRTYEKRPILDPLRILAKSVGHPLIVQQVEMPMRRKSDTKEPDFMKMICFGGIPACCLSAKGSGPTEAIANESAAHAMLDFFRSTVPNETIASLMACRDDNLNQMQLKPLQDMFREFENAIAADFLSISRVSQYDLTSPALIRGREVKKRVVMNLGNPLTGYSTKSIPSNQASASNAAASNGYDSDVQILEESGVESKKNTNRDKNFENGDTGDEVVILSDNLNPATQQVREADVIQKQNAQEFVSRQTENRKRKYSTHSSVEFGELNDSRNGPPEVMSSIPKIGSTSFVEKYSSDSDESVEIHPKRPRLDVGTPEATKESVVVHMVSKNQRKRDDVARESEEEIGEMVDEWDENDEQEVDDEVVLENVVSNENEIGAERAVTSRNTQNDEDILIETPSWPEFLRRRSLPIDFQSRTIGVVPNLALVQSTHKYVSSVTNRSFDSITELSKLTWDHYLNNCQPDAVYDRKMRARQLLFQEIQKLFPNKYVSLQVTGSTINGCGSYNSDVDMCLCYPTVGYRGRSFDDYFCDRSYSAKILRKIDKAFKRLPYKHPFSQLVKNCQFIPAKVPIIKLLLNGEFAGIDIDINVNNTAGIYNSHLIHYYSLSDVRFPALALMVKHWAMSAGVNNSQHGFMNSYTIIILVIHFLQCAVQPAVLPNLQYLFPSKFDKKLPLEELLLFGDVAEKIPNGPKNASSLGELLVGFFHYYSHFDFERYAISIRSAQTFSRSDLPKDTQNYPMFVEEPFDAVNTARTVRTANHMNAIRASFRNASDVFSRKKFTVRDLGIAVVPRD